LGQIFDDHYEQVYRYAYRRLGDKEQAQSVASESFCRLVEAHQKGKGPKDGVLYWLYRVTHNLIVDIYRQASSDPLPLYEKVLSDQNPLPEEALLLEQKRARVRWALRQLTQDQQQVLELKFMEGVDNKKVAEIMQKSVGAVKSLQHRGLASLARFLDQAAEQPALVEESIAAQSWEQGRLG
jgi:RNA polymerase sigma-70 factor (ECF subfamily)